LLATEKQLDMALELAQRTLEFVVLFRQIFFVCLLILVLAGLFRHRGISPSSVFSA
jgi:hypothetical protein